MHKTAILALALVTAAAPAAFAGNLGRPCTAAPQSQWLSLDALKAKVEALGYTVRKAKLNKESCAEIYTLDKSGARTELFLDPTSGQIVGRI
jgi:hypothetical protein